MSTSGVVYHLFLEVYKIHPNILNLVNDAFFKTSQVRGDLRSSTDIPLENITPRKYIMELISSSSSTNRVLPSLRRFIHVQHTKCKGKMIDPWDLITGVERWEALQYAKGNSDPFFLLPMSRGPGTKDCPNVIPSAFDKRIVGCICHPDATKIVFWWIHEGFPRRCNCNHWFVLERFELPKIYED